MIIGIISPDREATLPIAVHGTDTLQEFEAVIDTGFNGYLTLLSAEIAELDLPFHSQVLVTLGDASNIILRKFQAVMDWDGQARDVLVLEAEGGPLVGMALLYGYDVWLRILDGGHVKVEAVP